MFLCFTIVPLLLLHTVRVASALKDGGEAGIASSLYNVKLACTCIGQPGTCNERCCPWGDRYLEQNTAPQQISSYLDSGISFFKKREEPKHIIDLQSYANQISSTTSTYWLLIRDYFHDIHLKAIDMLRIPCTCALATLPPLNTIIEIIKVTCTSVMSYVWQHVALATSPPKENAFESLLRQLFSFACFENIWHIYDKTLWIICLLTSHIACIVITRFYYLTDSEDSTIATNPNTIGLQFHRRQDSGLTVNQVTSGKRSSTSLSGSSGSKAPTSTKSVVSADRSRHGMLSKRDSSKLLVGIKSTRDDINSFQSHSSLFIETNKSDGYTISQNGSDYAELTDRIGTDIRRDDFLNIIVSETSIGSQASRNDDISRMKDLTTIGERPEMSRQTSRVSSKMKPAPLFFMEPHAPTLSDITSACSIDAVVTKSVVPSNPFPIPMTRDTIPLSSPSIFLESDVTSGESISSGDIREPRDGEMSEEEHLNEKDDSENVDDDYSVNDDEQSDEDAEHVDDSRNNPNGSAIVEEESHPDIEEQQGLDSGRDSGTVSKSGSSAALSQEQHEEHLSLMANTIEMLSRENSQLKLKLSEKISAEVLSGSLGWGITSSSQTSSDS